MEADVTSNRGSEGFDNTSYIKHQDSRFCENVDHLHYLKPGLAVCYADLLCLICNSAYKSYMALLFGLTKHNILWNFSDWVAYSVKRYLVIKFQGINLETWYLVINSTIAFYGDFSDVHLDWKDPKNTVSSCAKFELT